MRVHHRLIRAALALSGAWAVYCLSAGALADGLEPHPNACANDLARLQFRNRGVVRSAMRFAYRMQPCYYLETPEEWSVPWGRPTGGARYPYLWQLDEAAPASGNPPRYIPPPLGVRSAVPLGGLGAGSVELRADGSLCDWNIFNNSPGAGLGKAQLNEALFGLRVKSSGASARAWTLRTQPPPGLPSIAQIEYAGAYPVTRLRFADPSLPLALDLYAYTPFKIRDPAASAAPAVIFTFNLSNPSKESVNADLLFNLPNSIHGVFSAADHELKLHRSGDGPDSGDLVARFGGRQATSVGADDDLRAIWNRFAASGEAGGEPLRSAMAKHGAIAANLKLAPGESESCSLVLSWRFPNRRHDRGAQRVGNYYSRLYPSAEATAAGVLDHLPETWRPLLEWQQLCFDNSLPGWLQDALINSLGTMAKTGMWLEDGRWRQWESFSCPAVDPVHIDFYRALPYALFFPALQRSQLRGFASLQRPDGFIEEDLGNSGRPMDSSNARAMGDCASSFVLGVWLQYLWTGDRAFLDELWPHAKMAAAWQIARSRRFGLPEHLNNTYDWWAFDQKDVVAYNAVTHLAALKAAAKLARVEGDNDFARVCLDRLHSGAKAFGDRLWNGRYYRAWWTERGQPTEALHSDALYGQLWAAILNLGWVVDPANARAQLRAEMEYNASPFGLKVMSRRGHDPIDDFVWQAGSLDWASLRLFLREDAHGSLAEAEKVVNVWRQHLRDFWDWRDLTRSDDGQPWCNSHYARQLIVWAIPLALSGQQYSAPEQRLSFDPLPDAPASLPWFVPEANGALERLPGGRFKLKLFSGALELQELRVGRLALRRPIRLRLGDAILIEYQN